MAEDRHYLTVGPDPKGRGLMAIISLGSPQHGDKNVTVCDVELVKNMQEAKKWFRKAMIEKPWETRQ
jgi:hypothetical protein